MKLAVTLAAGMLLALPAQALAQSSEVRVTMNRIDAGGVGAVIGTVTLTDTPQGLMVRPDLTGLPPGEHGFHVHERPDCGPGPNPQGQPAAGLAAGGHYDPERTGKHLGPHKEGGHKGDLPILVVGQDGRANQPATAPRLKVVDANGRSLMIHAGGDNYADEPQPLGGGGARIACGLIR
ncbi:MAG TPA: superoxide dismutase [Cu-Zn] SodC [Azospirillum sp.]|nr:superoxide dismutase [Cu-Zn] SodC [Azospirillum sp.]